MQSENIKVINGKKTLIVDFFTKKNAFLRKIYVSAITTGTVAYMTVVKAGNDWMVPFSY